MAHNNSATLASLIELLLIALCEAVECPELLAEDFVADSFKLVFISVDCFYKNVIGVLEATRALAFACFFDFQWFLRACTPILLTSIILPW